MTEQISKKKSKTKGKMFGKKSGGKKPPFSLFGKKPAAPPAGNEDPEEMDEME